MPRKKKQPTEAYSVQKPNSSVRVQEETETAELRKRVWQMTIAGATVRDIAERLNIGRSSVSNYRRAELELVQEETFQLATEWRDVQLERLDALMLTHWSSATRQHKVIDQNGEVVFLPSKDGVKSAELVLKIMQQRSRLLGLEKETIEHTGGIQIQWTDPITKDDDIGIGSDELDK